MTQDQWEREDDTRTRLTLDLIRGRFGRSPGTAALYASRAGEPSTTALIDALTTDGWRVLLPVLRSAPDWAYFTGWDDTQPAWRGIPQPAGARLGAEALRAAAVIVVPCLAAGRDGSRLGTGGGWYDRALPSRAQEASVLALSREAELLSGVPTEPHDVPVDVVVTERAIYGAVRG